MDLGVVQKGVWRDTATLWGDRHDSERLQWRERQQWLQLTDLRDIEPGVHSLSVTFRQQFAKKKTEKLLLPWKGFSNLGAAEIFSRLWFQFWFVCLFLNDVSLYRTAGREYISRCWDDEKVQNLGKLADEWFWGFFVLVFFVTGSKFAKIVQFSRLEDSNVLTNIKAPLPF